MLARVALVLVTLSTVSFAAAALPLQTSAPTVETLVAPGVALPDTEAAARDEHPASRLASSEVARGDPLARADPQVWLPVLVVTGSFGAAAEAAEESLLIQHDVVPLGDANGDGLADLLVQRSETPSTWTVGPEDDFWGDPSNRTLTAIAGGTYETLWALAVPSDAYWYLAGDVNGDDVEDLVFVTETSDYSSLGAGALVAGAYRFEYRLEENNQLLSGATGQPLFERATEFRSEGTLVFAFGLLTFVYAQDYDFTRSWLEPVREGTLPGMDLITARGHDTFALAFVFPTLVWYSRTSEVLDLERLDETGKTRWRATVDMGDAGIWVVDDRDYTGDDVPDFLLTQGDYSTHLLLFAFVTYQFLDLTEAGLDVVLIDGATGKEAWRHREEPFRAYAFVAPGGALDGDGRDVLLHVLGREEAGDAASEFRSRITALHGDDGTELATRTWEGEFALAYEFTDADQDGRGDLFFMHAPVSREAELGLDYVYPEKLEVVTPDYKPIWSLSYDDVGYGYFYYGDGDDGWDFDGDGVRDLAFENWDDEDWDVATVQFRSGATGAVLWSLGTDHQTLSLEVLDDANGDGTDDIVGLTFDVPDQPDWWEEDYDPDDEPVNYATHTGTLTIRRGADGETAWSKTVHEPVNGANVTGEYPWAWMASAGDVNGNGFSDLVLNFHSSVEYDVEYDDGWVWTREDLREPLEIAQLIEGGSGATVCTFPGECIPPPAGTLPSDVTLGPGAADPKLVAKGSKAADGRERGLLPGFEVALVGLAVAGLALARRRRA